MEMALEQIYRLIQESPVISIFGHSLPDGDCYGCQIGLKSIIKETFPNKKVFALGSGMPSLFSRLSPMDQVDDSLIAGSLAIIVDASTISRIEDQRILSAKTIVKIDHHIVGNDENLPYLSFVDPSRVSCAEIITEFAEKFGMKINRLAAESLYVGILTDSGRFSFYGTSDKTFMDVSKLFSYGVEAKSLMELLYKEDPKLVAYKQWLLENSKKDGQVIYVFLKPKDYQAMGLSFEVASEQVNVFRNSECPIYCLFTEDKDGQIRGELRGQRGFKVQPSAVKFGGGGHLYAAGVTLSKEKDINALLEELNKIKYLPED